MEDNFKVENIKIDEDFVDSIKLSNEVDKGYARILRESSRRKLSYNEVHELFYENLGKHIMATLTTNPEDFLGLPMHRAFSAKDIETRDITEISSFLAPPKEITNMNRANISNHPVFYAGDSEITALKEMDLYSKGKEFYLSSWKSKKLPHNMLIRLILFNNTSIDNPWRTIIKPNSFDEKFKGKIPDEKLAGLKRLNEKICELFVSNSKHYQITSFIAHEQLYGKSNTESKMLMPMFVYPSVKNKLNSANFALRPEFAKSYMLIDEVVHATMKSTKEGGLSYDIIKIGKLENGKIRYYEIVEDEENSKVRIDYLQCSCGLKVEGDKFKLGSLLYMGKPISVIELYLEAKRIEAITYLEDIRYLDSNKKVKTYNPINFKTEAIPDVEYIDGNNKHTAISLIGRKNFAAKLKPIDL